MGFVFEQEGRQGFMNLFKIEHEGDKLKSIFHVGGFAQNESSVPELIGKNHLQVGGWIFKRLSPNFPTELEPFVEKYIKTITSQIPFLEELNTTTLYLRIPSFDMDKKQAIDKVIADNKEKILKTENLIIDLRNNGGGSDGSFSNLLPILYTNPIRTVTEEFLSTKQNNQRFLDYLTEYKIDEGTQRWIRKICDKLQNKVGEFVNPWEEPVSVKHFDTVFEYPQNVGIIINEVCASTTEQFLLAAKQSKKVKLFGVTTRGALDTGNQLDIVSPCKEFRLMYSHSRSLRIPDFMIDNIGLQPDYYLDKSIPQYKWVNFVSEILNQ